MYAVYCNLVWIKIKVCFCLYFGVCKQRFVCTLPFPFETCVLYVHIAQSLYMDFVTSKNIYISKPTVKWSAEKWGKQEVRQTTSNWKCFIFCFDYTKKQPFLLEFIAAQTTQSALINSIKEEHENVFFVNICFCFFLSFICFRLSITYHSAFCIILFLSRTFYRVGFSNF